MKNRNRSSILVFLCTAAGLIAVGLTVWYGLPSGKPKSESALSHTRSVMRPVPTAVAYPLTTTTVRTFPGRVRANRRVELAFSVSGLLQELNAREGRSLRKGDVLARLDPRDFKYAVNVAGAQYADARSDFKRVRSLRDKGVLPEARYDKAEAAHDISEAELRIREKALEDSVLHAPFDGVVAKRYVENHEHVRAGQPVVSFQDISVIEVVIQEPERLIAHGGLNGLRKIQVRFDADGNRWFDASIREFSVQSDTVTGTYDVVVSLKPPVDIRVFPGMTATAKVEIADSPQVSDEGQDGALVPAQAIWIGRDGNSYVWIVEASGGNPHRRRVVVRSFCEGGVEIVSGLEPGNHVAVAGVHRLREDMQVRPMIKGKDGLDG